MNAQDIFTKVYRALRDRGFTRSGRYIEGPYYDEPVFKCLYNSRDGLQCAIALIDPEAAKEWPESIDVSHLWAEGKIPNLENMGIQSQQAFYRHLQGAHDSGRTPEEMERYLRETAEAFKLSVPMD